MPIAGIARRSAKMENLAITALARKKTAAHRTNATIGAGILKVTRSIAEIARRIVPFWKVRREPAMKENVNFQNAMWDIISIIINVRKIPILAVDRSAQNVMQIRYVQMANVKINATVRSFIVIIHA